MASYSITSNGSLGLTAAAVNSKVIRAIFVVASLGLTATTTYKKTLNLGNYSPAASLGLSSSSAPAIKRKVTSQGSLGLSSASKLNSRRAINAPKASLGLTSNLIFPNFKRALKSNVSLGLDYIGRISITPYLPPNLGAIVLLEATDIGNPATYALVVPRSSKTIYLDTTRSVYPAPFTLIN